MDDNVNTGETREISKNIAVSGVYQMCFSNKGISFSKIILFIIWKIIFIIIGNQEVAVNFYVSFKNRGVKHVKREHDKNIPVVEVIYFL